MTTATIKAQDLEFQVNAIFDALKVGQENREAIWAFLAPLKHKSLTTRTHYEHSLRVAILAQKIAAFMHLDQKALFFAGCSGRNCFLWFLDICFKAVSERSTSNFCKSW